MVNPPQILNVLFDSASHLKTPFSQLCGRNPTPLCRVGETNRRSRPTITKSVYWRPRPTTNLCKI